MSTATASRRLQRAAAAERAKLERDRRRLLARQHELRDELDRLDDSVAQLDERLMLLERLAPAEAGEDRAPKPSIADPAPAAPERPAGMPLRGTAIRETAVHVLAEHPEGGRPIHYRRWYELVRAAGFEIAGKDPLAVFLTQVSRSPVVAKTLDAGLYELDRDAPSRLQRGVASLQDELRRLTDGSATAGSRDRRQRRDALLVELGREERQLEEALRAFDHDARRTPLRAAS
jgi:hypothetical protein